MVYYNRTTGDVCTPEACDIPQAFAPRQLPTAWVAGYDPTARLASPDRKWEAKYSMALLYFHGGPECTVHIRQPVVRDVILNYSGPAEEDEADTLEV